MKYFYAHLDIAESAKRAVHAQEVAQHIPCTDFTIASVGLDACISTADPVGERRLREVLTQRAPGRFSEEDKPLDMGDFGDLFK